MKRLYQIMENSDTKLGKLLDIVLMVLIFINITIVIADSYGGLRIKYGIYIKIIELLSVVVFTFEYVLRLIASPLRYGEKYAVIKIAKYIITPMAIIDLLAIMPFYLPMLITFDFRVFRVLRVFRLLRVLKIKRYSKALDMIVIVFKKKRSELILSTFILMVMIFFAGSLMYYSENEVQPEDFPNILESVSWSLETMIFLGYNESVPLTPIGSIIGMIIVMLGLGWLTLPISILSAGFIEEVQKPKSKCPFCGKEK